MAAKLRAITRSQSLSVTAADLRRNLTPVPSCVAAGNMNKPEFFPKKQHWSVKYSSQDFANMSAQDSCCKHVSSGCDPCPPDAVTRNRHLSDSRHRSR